MERQEMIDWIKERLYVGKSLTEDDEEQVERLYQTLDRFCTYLHEEHGIGCIEDTTLEALRGFQFDLPAIDDQHLRIVFSHLGRDDLTEHLGMVSAD